MACADVAMAKVKAPIAIHLIICFLLYEIFKTSACLGLIIHFRQQRLFGALASHHGPQSLVSLIHRGVFAQPFVSRPLSRRDVVGGHDPACVSRIVQYDGKRFLS
jgi:hypothetical protein